MIDLGDYLDTEVFYSPIYWLLVGAAEIALIIGFRMQSLWGDGQTMGILSMVVTLLLVPVAGYVIVLWQSNK